MRLIPLDFSKTYFWTVNLSFSEVKCLTGREVKDSEMSWQELKRQAERVRESERMWVCFLLTRASVETELT